MEIELIYQEIRENGHNPNDFEIKTDNNKILYWTPKRDLDIRKIAKEEDVEIKTEVDRNSALSMYELLQLSESNIKDIEHEISQSDFEMLMMISQLSTKVKDLEKKIEELTKE